METCTEELTPKAVRAIDVIMLSQLGKIYSWRARDFSEVSGSHYQREKQNEATCTETAETIRNIGLMPATDDVETFAYVELNPKAAYVLSKARELELYGQVFL